MLGTTPQYIRTLVRYGSVSNHGFVSLFVFHLFSNSGRNQNKAVSLNVTISLDDSIVSKYKSCFYSS